MQKNDLRILSVNPGSRYLGVAVFLGTDLREWAVKVVGGESSKDKALKIISDLVRFYGVETLALKKLHPAKGSKNLNGLVSEIRKFGKRNALNLREYSIREVKSRLLPEGRGYKKGLVGEVLIRYPFLFNDAERERKSKNPYLIRMFEAIAMGIVCHDELDSRGQKVGKTMK